MDGKLAWPVEGGPSRWPVGDGSDAHVERQGTGMFAIDIPGPTTGVPALAVAPADCTVTQAIAEPGSSPCGVQVDVTWWDEPHAYAARYCHLAAVWVHAGQTLTVGTPVGVVGTTGNSTGVHLHFVLWVDGIRVRPEDWLDFGSPEPDMPSQPPEEHAMNLDRIRAALDRVWTTKAYLEGPKPMTRKRRNDLAALILESVIVVKEETGVD